MNTIGKARDVTTETKAAFIAGLFSGSNISNNQQAKEWRDRARKHAETAAMIAFGDGVFNPMDVWGMERFYDEVVSNCENGKGYAAVTPND